jgi:hypothetical protein
MVTQLEFESPLRDKENKESADAKKYCHQDIE